MTLEGLKALREAADGEIDRSTLVDINTVKVDTSLPVKERIEQFAEQIRNPYCFLCGDVVVHLEFNENGKELKEHMKNYFISCKRG